MSLRIDKNPDAHLTRSATGSDEATGQRLTSGARIDRAGGANGLSSDEGTRAAIRRLGLAARDALDSMALVQATDASMGDADGALRRMRELAGRASDPSLPDADRAHLDGEVRSLLTDLQNSMGDDAPRLSVPGADASRLDLGDVGVSTPAAAASAVSALDGAIRSVGEIRTGLGDVQNRLERTLNRARLTADNVEAAASRIRDADRAAGLVDVTRRQITDEPGTAMLAQANHTGNGILRLLSHP